LLSSELVDIEKYRQPGRCEELYPIKIHHHQPGSGHLAGQEGDQFWCGQRVDLTGHGDHTCLGTGLGRLEPHKVGKVAGS